LAGSDCVGDVFRAVVSEAVNGDEVIIGPGRCFGLGEVEALSSRFGHCLGYESAGESRWVGVFVVDPDVHVELFGFIECDFPEAEPFFGEIWGH